MGIDFSVCAICGVRACGAGGFVSSKRRVSEASGSDETPQTLASIDAAYRAYYDAASDDELAEESGWAELGEKALAEMAESDIG